MKTGDRPRRDTGVIDDWDDNDSPCPLALREVAKLSDDQPLDLVFGLWDFFHDTTLTDFYCDDASRVAVSLRSPTLHGPGLVWLSLLRLLGALGERNQRSAISMKNDLCGKVRAASANRMHSAALLRN